MAWFKQNDQKSPASPPSQPPAVPAPPERPAVAPVPVAPPHAAPVESAGTSAAASRLSRGLTLRGEISGREDLSIDGELEGTLHLDGARVTIGPSGRVRANVSAREIVVHGDVLGDLRAEERIEIGRSGKLEGNAAARRIAVEEGATIHGLVEVLRPGEVARSAESAAASRPGAAHAARMMADSSTGNASVTADPWDS